LIPRQDACGAAKGGSVTFEEFLDAELDGLGRFARVLTGDRQQAHDTLAESLIKVQVHWRRIGVMDRPLPYVRRIITNTFLQQKRSWVDRMFHSMSPEALPERLSAPQVERVDDRSQLHELLQTLPRQQRAAIVLRYYLDLTDAEIADALGSSTGAVRANISRGFARLRLTGLDSEPDAAGQQTRRLRDEEATAIAVSPSGEDR